MIRIDWLTEMTGKPVCLATRSAVRCRVPDSLVSMLGSGTSWVAARRMRVTSRSQHDAAVHLRELAQAGGRELDVEREAAGGDRLDDLVVAEHDERTGAAAQDALEAVAQLGAGGDGGEGGAQQLVVVLLRAPRRLRRRLGPRAAVGPRPVSASYRACGAAPRPRRAALAARAAQPASSRPRVDGSATVAASTTRMPSGTGPPPTTPGRHDRPGEAEPARLGEPAVHAGDRRISPASPTSPKAMVPCGSGRSVMAPASARRSRGRRPAR